MRFPLRYQLLIPLLAVAVLSLIATTLVYAWLATRQTQSRIDAQVQGVARVLSESNFPLTQSVLEQMKLLSGADFAITDFAGSIDLATLPLPPDSLPTDSRVASFDKLTLSAPLALGSERYRYASVELSARASRPEPQVLHILFPYEDFLAAWRSAFYPPLWVGLGTIAAIAIVVMAFAARISRSAQRLGREIARLAAGDFSPLELPATNDELRDLGEAINQTGERLADYQQQIVHTEQIRTLGLLGAGLAHEMRNAATGCRLAVDLHGGSCDGETESLDVARQQLQLMENRLQRFLSIGKPNVAIKRQPLDLVELVESLLPLVRPMARHAQVELDWHPPATPLPLEADPDGIGQGILNVLLNAIEAAQGAAATGGTAAKVTVRAAIDPERDEVVIEIGDTGHGPPENLRESLYRPFATSKPEGVGLGLAVASEAFVAHGGSVDWRREGEETIFVLRLPVTREEATDGATADSR